MQSDVGTMQCVGRTRRKAKCHAVPCSNWCRKKLATCNKPKQQKLVAISCTIDRGVARGCGPHRAALARGGKRTKIVFKNSRENSGCNFICVCRLYHAHFCVCQSQNRLFGAPSPAAPEGGAPAHSASHQLHVRHWVVQTRCAVQNTQCLLLLLLHGVRWRIDARRLDRRLCICHAASRYSTVARGMLTLSAFRQIARMHWKYPL